jgi:hypothetical protein
MRAADAAAVVAVAVAAIIGSGTGGRDTRTDTEMKTEVNEGAEGNGGNEDVSSTPLKKKGRAA